MTPDTLIPLSPFDLAVAALLVMLLAGLSWRLQLAIGRRMLIAAARSTVQLLLLGLVLKALFDSADPWLVAGLAFHLDAYRGAVGSDQ